MLDPSPSPVYLDYNATAPIRPDVIDAMAEAMAVVGNPSSVHAAGRAARRLITRARGQVAALVGASPEAVIFTSGGTEANNQALLGGDGAYSGVRNRTPLGSGTLWRGADVSGQHRRRHRS